MSKVTLNDVANISGAESAAIGVLNDNWDRITAVIENTLSRDGDTPNSMGADLDMDNNDILNVDNIDVNTMSIDGVPVTVNDDLYASGSIAGLQSFKYDFNTVTLLLADTARSYSNTTAGEYIRTRSEGFAYRVAASGATDHDVTTAGGLKLYVISPNVRAAGGIGDGVADDTNAITAVVSAGKVYVDDGFEFLTDEIIPTAAYELSGLGRLTNANIDESILLVDTPYASALPGGFRVKDVTLDQPHSANFADGSANNHARLKFRGFNGAWVDNVKFENGDLCLHFGRGGTSGDPNYVQSYNGFSKDCLGTNINGMFLEFFGVSGGSHTGHRAEGSGSVYTTTISSVDTGTDIATLADATAFSNGDKVTYTTSGTPIGGLTSGSTYYISSKSGSTVKLATSYRSAVVSVSAIDLTSAGTGTHTITAVRAQQHGVRMSSIADTENSNMLISASIKQFSRGASIQWNAFHNTIQIVSEDCLFGVDVDGRPESVPVVNLAAHNRIEVISNGDDYAVYDGGSVDNHFIINAKDNGSGAIFQESDGGTAGYSLRCKFEGTAKTCSGRIFEIKGDDNTLNLDGYGVSTAVTTHGAIISGDRNKGRVHIDTAGTGLLISGSDCVLDLSALNCTTPLTVSGSRNVIVCNIDGNVTLSGDNNTLTGYVSGDVTDSGTGNDFTGLNGRLSVKAYTGLTTDASGFCVITHNLGKSNYPVAATFAKHGTAGVLSNDYLETFTDNAVTYRLEDFANAAAASLTGITAYLTLLRRN